MAVPAYTHDLTDIAIGSIAVDPGAWDESSDAAWDDAGAMVDDSNLYYNGTACVSAQFTKDGVGTILYEHTSSVTIPTDGAVLIHSMWAAPPALATLANGGVRALVGNGFGVFKGYKANGTDTHKGLIWTQYAVDPSLTADYTVGSPATPYNTFGIAVSATAQARGNPNAVNAIRYGRCEQVYTGGDEANGYAVLSGFAAIDDAAAAKLGLLKPIEGGYKQQGLMSLGTVATSVDFRDSNKKIIIEDTPNVSASFNRCEVVNTGSRVDWDTFDILALGTNAKYQFEVMDDTATVNKTSCVFTDLDTFKYGSGSTILNSTHRGCEPVSQLSATMTGGTIDKPINTVGMYVDNLDLVTGYTFNSDGTGHAVDLGTISSNTSVTWDNTDSGYGASDTTNATITVNVPSGVALTINVSATSSTPTVNNTAGTPGTINIVVNPVTTSVTVRDSVTKAVIQGVAVTIRAADLGPLPFEDTVTIIRSGDVATVSHTSHGLSTGQKVEIKDADQNEYNRIKTVTKIDADSYSYAVFGSPVTPATGTISATAMLIDGLTNASGVISDARTLSSNQGVTGIVQKGSTLPVYKPQDIATTVDSSNGVTITLLLISD